MGDNYYQNVYLKRLNRYGLNYQSRIQRQREENFKKQLQKSVYLVTFDYNAKNYEGELVPRSQDETKILQYLLTDINLEIPSGTILQITNDGVTMRPWLVYYLEDLVASGYNRYIMLKMTHYLTWKDRDGNTQTSYAYMYGQEDNMLKDELKSRSRSDTLYTENLKESFFVIPTNENIKKDDYLEVGEGKLLESYVVTGYDIQSTPGVEYVSVDPTYIRDKSDKPKQDSTDNNEDFYWLNNGGNN